MTPPQVTRDDLKPRRVLAVELASLWASTGGSPHVATVLERANVCRAAECRACRARAKKGKP